MRGIDPELSEAIDRFLDEEEHDVSGLLEDYDTDQLYEEKRYGERFGGNEE